VSHQKASVILVEVLAGVVEEGSLENDEVLPTPDSQTIGFEMIEMEPCISLQALNGIHGFQTMRVTGYVGKKAI